MNMNREKIFIDSDIILDVLLYRQPFVNCSRHFLALVESNVYSGFTSTLIMANCHYIVSNQKDKNTADECIQYLASILSVLPFTDKELSESLSSGFRDFEDGMQYYIALNNGIQKIVTRNISDYPKGRLDICTPVELIAEKTEE